LRKPYSEDFLHFIDILWEEVYQVADQWNNRQKVTKDKKEGKNKKEGIPGEGGKWVRKDGSEQGDSG
jgi:hypothetical protein